MMTPIKPTSGPHISAKKSVAEIMRQVMIALIPATVFGLFCFGWPAIFLFLISTLAAVVFEAICLQLAGRPVKAILQDGSAFLTGWLVAMTLPPFAPAWIAVVGAGLAIILGKQVYGGLGQNLFNPAMLARIALLISFPIEMTTWANVSPLFFPASPGFADSWAITFSGVPLADSMTGATTLGFIKTEFSQQHFLPDILKDYSVTATFFGWSRGSLGETSTVLLALGGGWLIRQKIITWSIPATLLGTVFLLSSLFHLIDSSHYVSPFLQLNSGAIMLVAFFIATDYVTSPNTPLGQCVFGVGCGVLIFVIRTWGAYPEGAGFAVLLMNAATPLIDYYIKPRIYGRDRHGKPLEINKEDSTL